MSAKQLSVSSAPNPITDLRVCVLPQEQLEVLLNWHDLDMTKRCTQGSVIGATAIDAVINAATADLRSSQINADESAAATASSSDAKQHCSGSNPRCWTETAVAEEDSLVAVIKLSSIKAAAEKLQRIVQAATVRAQQVSYFLYPTLSIIESLTPRRPAVNADAGSAEQLAQGTVGLTLESPSNHAVSHQDAIGAGFNHLQYKQLDTVDGRLSALSTGHHVMRRGLSFLDEGGGRPSYGENSSQIPAGSDAVFNDLDPVIGLNSKSCGKHTPSSPAPTAQGRQHQDPVLATGDGSTLDFSASWETEEESKRALMSATSVQQVISMLETEPSHRSQSCAESIADLLGRWRGFCHVPFPVRVKLVQHGMLQTFAAGEQVPGVSREENLHEHNSNLPLATASDTTQGTSSSEEGSDSRPPDHAAAANSTTQDGCRQIATSIGMAPVLAHVKSVSFHVHALNCAGSADGSSSGVHDSPMTPALVICRAPLWSDSSTAHKAAPARADKEELTAWSGFGNNMDGGGIISSSSSSQHRGLKPDASLLQLPSGGLPDGNSALVKQADDSMSSDTMTVPLPRVGEVVNQQQVQQSSPKAPASASSPEGSSGGLRMPGFENPEIRMEGTSRSHYSNDSNSGTKYLHFVLAGKLHRKSHLPKTYSAGNSIHAVSDGINNNTSACQQQRLSPGDLFETESILSPLRGHESISRHDWYSRSESASNAESVRPQADAQSHHTDNGANSTALPEESLPQDLHETAGVVIAQESSICLSVPYEPYKQWLELTADACGQQEMVAMLSNAAVFAGVDKDFLAALAPACRYTTA